MSVNRISMTRQYALLFSLLILLVASDAATSQAEADQRLDAMAAKHSADFNSLEMEHNPVWAKYEAIKAQIEDGTYKHPLDHLPDVLKPPHLRHKATAGRRDNPHRDHVDL